MCHNGGAPDAPLWQHARACCTILSFFALPFSLKLCPPVPSPINSTCEYSSARLLTRSGLSKCTTCVINRPSYSGYLNEERARRVHRGRPVAIDRENKTQHNTHKTDDFDDDSSCPPSTVSWRAVGRIPLVRARAPLTSLNNGIAQHKIEQQKDDLDKNT